MSALYPLLYNVTSLLEFFPLRKLYAKVDGSGGAVSESVNNRLLYTGYLDTTRNTWQGASFSVTGYHGVK